MRRMIVELRQYTLLPGARDTLVGLFEREFVTGQEAVGITLGGRFLDLDDPDRFVWLRGFPDMERRARSLRAFSSGSVWQEHREANATLLDSDDALLLRGPGYRAPAGTGPVTATLCHPRDGAAFAGHFARRLRPALSAAGAPPTAVHRTEHAENDFPALPVRTSEEVLLWFTPGGAPPPLPGLSEHLLAPPRHLRLQPVGTAQADR